MNLQEQPIVQATDNRHELIVAVCSKCQEREIKSRQDLESEKWRRLVEPRLEGHEGFLVCPQHGQDLFRWEDLY